MPKEKMPEFKERFNGHGTIDMELPRERGRPIEYDHAIDKQVYRLCLAGFTNEELADYLGISTDTFYRWKNHYPHFSEALKHGREFALGKVARSFYKRAVGFTHVVKKDEVINGEIVTLEKEVYYPPDVMAGDRWMANRSNGKWGTKPTDAAPPANPLVGITINTTDPIKAAEIYHKLISGG